MMDDNEVLAKQLEFALERNRLLEDIALALSEALEGLLTAIGEDDPRIAQTSNVIHTHEVLAKFKALVEARKL
jgi:hypothetical protein